MEKNNHIILGVHITERTKHAPQVQSILTSHGCCIKTRLGLHWATDVQCSSTGVVILELLDNQEMVQALENDLNAIEGVEIQKIVFSH